MNTRNLIRWAGVSAMVVGTVTVVGLMTVVGTSTVIGRVTVVVTGG